MSRALTLVIALALAANAHADVVPIRVVGNVVFPAARARELLQQCSRSVPENVTGSWDPSPEQIKSLETRLPAALKQALAKRGVATAGKWDFGRQYGGLVIGGRKIVYVNAYPFSDALTMAVDDKRGNGWTMRVVNHCDGGEDFFGVEYDPLRQTFEHFEFSGAFR